MSQFSFNEYNAVRSATQNKSSAVRVGYFKLADDGDTAIVRINASSLDDLYYASVHTISMNGSWTKVSCLNPIGSYDNCELCKAVNEGNKAVAKAAKRVYVPMLVSYQDKTTGQWSAPMPVIWDRPIGFARELATKIQTYGNLKEILLKITRNGAARDMKTTYSLDYAMPTIFKPEMIPADFSAFNNFKINKHSYWEKTAEEVHTFLTTGAFPTVNNNESDTNVSVAQVAQAYQQAAPQSTYTPAPQPAVQTPQVEANTWTVPTQPTAQPTQEQPAQPTNKFSGFSF